MILNAKPFRRNVDCLDAFRLPQHHRALPSQFQTDAGGREWSGGAAADWVIEVAAD
jgi:hypothetical protein